LNDKDLLERTFKGGHKARPLLFVGLILVSAGAYFIAQIEPDCPWAFLWPRIMLATTDKGKDVLVDALPFVVNQPPTSSYTSSASVW
jgi:hypothetical protein